MTDITDGESACCNDYYSDLGVGAMQLNQIRYFLVLYEERNFTRAARRCGVSQPSLTNAIKRLEQIFGSPLFERTSRNTEPTQLGQVVRPYLEQITRYAEEAKRKAEHSLHR